MKKLSIVLVCVFCSFALFAQENENGKNKKDYSDLFPKAGTFAVGLDAAQIVKFIGAQTFGWFNNNASIDSPIAAFQSDFFGRYFLLDKLALRVRFGLDVHNYTERGFVRDDYKFFNDPFSEEETVDAHKYRNSKFELGIGAEYRRSLWRLQGYVGGELFFGYGYVNNSYEYGNAITEMNQNPTTHNFGNNILGSGVRALKRENDKTFYYGGGLFLGVDFFIAKNVSVGVEFNLRAEASYTGEIADITESWQHNKVFIKEKLITPANSDFQIKPLGFLNLMFYF
jgi:hypothetical protein